MKLQTWHLDRMMVMILSDQIRNMIEVDIQRDWILKQVVTKLGCPKIDNSGDTAISSHDNDDVNLICDSKMDVTLSYQIRNMIKVTDQKNWITQQIVTKFGSVNIDDDGDTMMNSDATNYHACIMIIMNEMQKFCV